MRVFSFGNKNLKKKKTKSNYSPMQHSRLEEEGDANETVVDINEGGNTPGIIII